MVTPELRELQQQAHNLFSWYKEIQRPDGMERDDNASVIAAEKLLFQELFDPQILKFLVEHVDLRAAREAINVVQGIKQLCVVEETDTITPNARFHQILDQSMYGRNDLLQRLFSAKRAGIKALKEINEQHPSDEIMEVLQSNYESIVGIDLPPEFKQQLNDPSISVVVISLDINSTFNVHESYPTPILVARAQERLKQFAAFFRARFPNKQLVMPINTGRPGLYAWGFAEGSFHPDPSTRLVAVAESGGVIIDNLETGSMHVAVEDSQEWQNELDHMRNYLLQRIQDSNYVHIEPKLSMLSIRLADQQGRFLHRTKLGEKITPEWINSQLNQYFSEVTEQLDQEVENILNQIGNDIPDVETAVVDALSKYKNGHLDGSTNGPKDKRAVIKDFQELLFDLKEEYMIKLLEIRARLRTLELMSEKGLLQAKYNPTAGYVDIGHAHLNKFNTLMNWVRARYEVNSDNILYVHIGDSSTDIIPTEHIDADEINDGAGRAYLVGVQNSNAKVRAAIQARGNNGIMTQRPFILGLMDLYTGLLRALNE